MPKALILVGGFGTRLRPLTLTRPKPCVPFVNKEMVIHQIEALKKVGVDTVVLAVNYRPEVMSALLKPWEEKLGVKIQYSREEEPLGTAGPIALAKKYLVDENAPDSPFFVLNSDVTSEFPFESLLKFHKNHGKEGTIMVTKVSEPSKYGVVLYDEEGKIKSFVEKPQEYVGNKINAGIYIFNPSVLDRIEVKPTSIEQEVFPAMAASGELYCMELEGFWMDIGQPKDYITGLCLYLTSLKKKKSPQLAPEGDGIIGPVVIHPTAKIGKDCVIGPFVSIGPDCVVGDGVRLQRTSLFSGVTVKQNSWLSQCIVGWDSMIGKWVRMEGVTVLGSDVTIKDELYVNGTRILDHKTIKESVPSPQILM
eukprot:TRINITY_DN9435_c0_g1_i1.p1 TRINITY_DN9435_c0_g1~~TRINITY_DN9435_c0_g1_i1.p1  ORF type:complete len:378 (+),score=75.67 TRINITY_DN9435_c0_g1_i1:40-1134(+)